MNNSTNIKVGALVPTFNRVEYLSSAVKSVLEQSYNNLEIIVIDNGSTDGTAEFMSGIKDTRVRYIVNDQNLGMIGSINKGVKLFSDEVEWCTVLSDDDLLDKDFVKNLLQSVVASGARSVIHSHRIFIDSHGNRIREAKPSPREETAFDYMIMRAEYKRETYLTGVLFDRRAFIDIHGYPSFTTGLASDDAFIFALALKDRLVFDQNAVAYIRLHQGAESATALDGIKKLRTLDEFADYCKTAARASSPPDQDKLREFEQSLNKYFRALSSEYWVKAGHCAGQVNGNRKQLAELIALARENPGRFTFRVKLAVGCYRITGIFPESYSWYSALWEKIKAMAHFLRSHRLT